MTQVLPLISSVKWLICKNIIKLVFRFSDLYFEKFGSKTSIMAVIFYYDSFNFFSSS